LSQGRLRYCRYGCSGEHETGYVRFHLGVLLKSCRSDCDGARIRLRLVEFVHAKSSASLFLTGVAIACSTQRAFGRPGGRSSARRASFQRMYIRLAALSAPVHPARSPLASNRLARAIVAENFDCNRCCACFREAGVGCRLSWASTDCGAVNPAFGLPADWRMAVSNCAMSSLHGPACATAMVQQSVAPTISPVIPKSFDIVPRLPGRSTWPVIGPGDYSPNPGCRRGCGQNPVNY
jgi:hypothetical protein